MTEKTFEEQRYSFRPKHSEETKLKISLARGGKNSRTAWHVESVRVMKNKLSRRLRKGEIIHHIDHQPWNNHPDNLHLFNSLSEHQSYHEFLRNIIRESLGIKKSQKQLQREWYLKNRERILVKQGVKYIGKNSRF